MLLGSIASKHFSEIMRSVISVTEFAGNPAWFLSAIFQNNRFPVVKRPRVLDQRANDKGT